MALLELAPSAAALLQRQRPTYKQQKWHEFLRKDRRHKKALLSSLRR